MFIRESGSGPAVLLLHGSPSSPHDFDPLMERLADSRKVLAPVMPGYMGESMDEATYSIAGSIALIEDALLARGVTEVAAVGFSAGALRAFGIALGGRIRVSTLVSLGGLAGYDEADRQVLRGFASLIRSRKDMGSPELIQILAMRMLSPGACARPELIARMAAWIECSDPASLAVELNALADSESYYPQLHELHIPLLARVGSLDQAAPPIFSERMTEAIPGAKLEIVEGKGHALLIEDEGPTLDSVTRFLGT
jgi:pimeloyl-ACP methyl ester carboxylesterase